MKKKLFIASSIILIIFILILALTLGLSKKPADTITENQFEDLPLTQDQAIDQTQDDKAAAEAIDTVYQEYPWYDQIPIETNDFTIIYDFDDESFRIRILTQSTAEIKAAALAEIEKLGVDSEKIKHYFVEPEAEPEQSGFQNLLN